MRRGVESFTYNLSNHLAEFYNLKIIIYTWSNNNPINWGKWHKKIKIRNNIKLAVQELMKLI